MPKPPTSRVLPPDDDWYVVDLDARPPVRKVNPIAVEGKWLRIGRQYRVKIGSLAYRGRVKALAAAKDRADELVTLARMELRRRETVVAELMSF